MSSAAGLSQYALPIRLLHLLLQLYIVGTEMNATCLPAVASVNDSANMRAKTVSHLTQVLFCL